MSQIDDKDKIDGLAKVYESQLQMLQNYALRKTSESLLKWLKLPPEEWYRKQLAYTPILRRQITEQINAAIKKIMDNTSKALSGMSLPSRDARELIESNKEALQRLQGSVISTYNRSVANIGSQIMSRQVTSAVSLFDTINKAVEQNISGGAIVYVNGKNYNWDSYMAMKFRTDVNRETGANLIQESRKNGIVFYACSYYGDCAPDHAEMQERGIFYDATWDTSIDRADEIQEYIDSHKLMSIQDAMGEAGNWFTTRPNCRHYFSIISVDEVLGMSSNKELSNWRDNAGMEFNGAYKPEKYKALQKQHANERELRNLKDEKRANEMLLKKAQTQDQIERQKFAIRSLNSKISRVQAKQRELIDNNSSLERDYSKEASRYYKETK